MRGPVLIAAFVLSSVACSNAAEEGRKEAKREADQENQKAKAQMKTVEKIKPPVAQGIRLPCPQLIDPAAFTSALEETEPLTVRDSTGTMIDSTASCVLVRGGDRPDAKAQEKIIKKNGRLGTIPGDPVCIVTLYCWVVESADKFKEHCRTAPDQPGTKVADESTTGGWACKETLPQGSFDIDSYKFIDEDTKCLVQVTGGPSMTDNDVIATCARTARASIGPEHIKAGAPARYSTDTGSGSGSESGSAAK